MAKLNNDKIALEQSMEMEEEGIVNRLQRQIGELFTQCHFCSTPVFLLLLVSTSESTLVLLHVCDCPVCIG